MFKMCAWYQLKRKDILKGMLVTGAYVYLLFQIHLWSDICTMYYEQWKYVLRQYQQWVYESNQDVTGSKNKDGAMIMFEFLIRLVLLQILSKSSSPKK